ncbi:MAG: hypothetical protein ACREL7_00625 [Longimicrobiales bacterium]
MLTREKLIDLYRSRSDQHVLSIYLNAEEHDPAKRRAWRRAFDHILEYVNRTVDAADREDFESALAHIRKELRQYDAFLPDRGWAGFAAADQLLYAETMPVPMPNFGCWEEGSHVAPYVRALKQSRPVISVLVDSRRARVYRYQNGNLRDLRELIAEGVTADIADFNASKRASTHTGTRGETGTDVAQRLQDVHTDRMVKQLADLISEEAGPEGFVVIGGTHEMIAATTSRLHKSMAGRVHEESSLSFDLSIPDVRKLTEMAASRLSERRHSALVAGVIDLARAGGRGSLGRDDTDRALLDHRVEFLVVSRELATRYPDYVDECVGLAFEQGAEVEEVAGSAGSRLDAEGDGIGARVRFKT